jgi:AcrR family transcriptional regulator
VPRARTLSTAEDRRSDVIAAAFAAFARSGYFGANTTEIAHDAGISQAYLYRLYANKEALFVATLVAAKQAVVADIERVIAAAPDGEPLTRTLMRAAAATRTGRYTDAETVLLHAVAAAHVEPIGHAVRECFRDQFDRLRHLGATEEDIRAYLAWSQYANVVRAAGLSEDSADPRDRGLLPPAL